MPNTKCGACCAAISFTAFVSDGSTQSGRSRLTFIARPCALRLKLMADNMLKRGSKAMQIAQIGWQEKASWSSGIGTTTFSPIRRVCSALFSRRLKVACGS
jgi:hypothetical protein